MNPILIYCFTSTILLIIIWYFDKKQNLLRDASNAIKKPYSFSRVQLAWWMIIILSAFITIIISNNAIPTFRESTLILLGISSATTISGRLTDLSDQKDTTLTRHQDDECEGIIIDIISDQNGASIHRLQTVLFNIVFGIWMIVTVLKNLPTSSDINAIIPDISENNLVLIGLSSATYAALKIPENKATQNKDSQPEVVNDESKMDDSAKG